jgi:hypothetical protein
MASRTGGDADCPNLPANERLSVAKGVADDPRFQREITRIRGLKAD